MEVGVALAALSYVLKQNLGTSFVRGRPPSPAPALENESGRRAVPSVSKYTSLCRNRTWNSRARQLVMPPQRIGLDSFTSIRRPRSGEAANGSVLGSVNFKYVDC